MPENEQTTATGRTLWSDTVEEEERILHERIRQQSTPSSSRLDKGKGKARSRSPVDDSARRGERAAVAIQLEALGMDSSMLERGNLSVVQELLHRMHHPPEGAQHGPHSTSKRGSTNTNDEGYQPPRKKQGRQYNGTGSGPPGPSNHRGADFGASYRRGRPNNRGSTRGRRAAQRRQESHHTPGTVVEQGLEGPVTFDVNLDIAEPALLIDTSPEFEGTHSDVSDDESEFSTDDEARERPGEAKPWPPVSERRKFNDSARRRNHERADRRQELTRSQFEAVTGRIHPPFGLTPSLDGQSMVRSTMLLGLLPSSIYVSERGNRAFTGITAERASSHELAPQRGAFQPLRTDPIYSRVPTGIPETGIHIMWLRHVVRHLDITPEARAESFQLLSALYTVASRVDPSIRDHSMHLIMEDGAFGEHIRPNIPPQYFVEPNISYNLRRLTTGRIDNATAGLGLPMPAPDQLFDISAQARYASHHWHPGSASPQIGVLHDYAHRVHVSTVIASSLGRALAPTHPEGRSAFMRLYNHLAVLRRLYEERALLYNANHPNNPFTPHPGGPITLRRMRIDPTHAGNMNLDDVVDVLIQNRIPVEWMNQAYAYGFHALNQQYGGGQVDDALLADLDSERLHRLDAYGPPILTPEWDMWWTPSPDDLARIRALIRAQEARGNSVMDNPHWHIVGAPLTRRYLTRRPAVIAEPALPLVVAA